MSGKRVESESDVVDWLKTQGYALEYETADLFAKAGFRVSLGQTYIDPLEGKVRDIDVVAGRLQMRVGPVQHARPPIIHSVIECKTSPTGPWVVRKTHFDTDGTPEPEPIASLDLREVWATRPRLIRDSMPYPTKDGELPFAVMLASHRSAEDVPHKSVSQAISAALGWVKGGSPRLAWPTVVLDAKLFTLSYGSGSEVVREAEWERVLISTAPRTEPTLVDIVTRDALETYCRVVYHEFDNLLDAFWDHGYRPPASQVPG